jgi:hypothetical protein
MQQSRDQPVMSQADACTYRLHHPMTSQADTEWALLFQFCLSDTPTNLDFDHHLILWTKQSIMDHIHNITYELDQ